MVMENFGKARLTILHVHKSRNNHIEVVLEVSKIENSLLCTSFPTLIWTTQYQVVLEWHEQQQKRGMSIK